MEGAVVVTYDFTGSSFRACVTVEGEHMTFHNEDGSTTVFERSPPVP